MKPEGYGIDVPSKGLQGMRQDGRGANSIPWIVIVGLAILDQAGNRAVAAPDIQHGRAWRDLGRE